MGSKSDRVSSMNIAWNFVECPQERRAKLYVTGKVRESAYTKILDQTAFVFTLTWTEHELLARTMSQITTNLATGKSSRSMCPRK